MGELVQGEMVYEQLTIADWMEMKTRLRQELQNVSMAFVRIGYVLRKIRDGKLYETDGYKSVAEFAKAEYGIDASTVSRFMSINERYSIDGYSERLDPQYIGYGQSKLSEMLALPASDMEIVSPEMSREDIRDLRRFNQEEPEADGADDLYELFDDFFRDNREAALEIIGNASGLTADELKEIVNPSGARTYRKGIYFVAMYESGLKVKQFGGEVRDMSWKELCAVVSAIFGDEIAAAGDPEVQYDLHYGIEREEKPEPAAVPDSGEADEVEEPDEPEEEEDEEPEDDIMPPPTEEIAPAQKSAAHSVFNENEDAKAEEKEEEGGPEEEVDRAREELQKDRETIRKNAERIISLLAAENYDAIRGAAQKIIGHAAAAAGLSRSIREKSDEA
jgi:hypothetical protein